MKVTGIAFTVSVGLLLQAMVPACWSATRFHLDPTNSVIQVHLDSAGALGFLGHRHLIETSIARGEFVYAPDELPQSSVKLEVEAGKLRVVDPDLSAKNREAVQKTMLSDRVLGVGKYPEITFHSTSIEKQGDDLLITGDLTLHGTVRPVEVLVQLEETAPQLKATGACHFKQTTFGIRPVTFGLGSIRVRDRVQVTFEVYGQR